MASSKLYDYRVLIYSKQTCPCNGCKDRYTGCHSECDKYKEYQRKMEIFKEEQKKCKTKESQIDEYVVTNNKKINKEKAREL